MQHSRFVTRFALPGFALATLVTLMALERPVEACSFAPLTMHELDPDEQMVDTTPPEAPQLADIAIVRRPVNASGCAGARSSCDGSGEVGIQLAPTADDRSQPEQIGYVLEFAGGALPENLGLPEEPVRPDGSGTIWLLFSDRDQSLDFQLSVRAVDLAGNEGAALTVDVVSSQAAGCSAGSGRGQPTTWALLFGALCLAAGRRRWRWRGGRA